MLLRGKSFDFKIISYTNDLRINNAAAKQKNTTGMAL